MQLFDMDNDAATSVKVKLTRHELRAAANSGIERHLDGIGKNRTQLYGADKRKMEWQNNIIGSIGEYAVSKYLNIYWEPATSIDCLDNLIGDVGVYQVRATQWPQGSLLIVTKDKPDAVFILATVELNIVTLQGWLYGHEGKSVGEFKENDTYWISQNMLHKMASLP